jgi:pyrophosphate--fructose-6-phosphate 1-phosphotransferase
MQKELSALQKARLSYKPKLPKVLANGIKNLDIKYGEETSSVADADEIKKLFNHSFGKPVVTFVEGSNNASSKVRNVGVILSGGQAPGGHNVIAGLYDALKESNSENKLYGFLGGPSGIINGEYIEFSDAILMNTVILGFDIIGSGRNKLETEEHFKKTWEPANSLAFLLS